MRLPGGEWAASRPYLFFGALVAYVYALGSIGLPTVHYFYDAVAIRDMGTVWHELSWTLKDERHFLPVAILSQHEGVLQFLVLNAYSYLVGDRLALNPATLQFPNTVLTVLSAVVAYRLGRRLHSARYGHLCAMTFVLMPWLGMTIRLPWVFNLLSVLTQFTTLLCYLGFAMEPDRRFYRIAAPLSLAIYLTTGVDWPSFLFVLALFLLLARRLRVALSNPFNAFPLAVLAVYALWAAALYAYGRWYDPQRAHLYQRAILLFPFFKVGTSGPLPSIAAMGVYAAQTLGVTVVLAGLGLVRLLWRGAEVEPSAGRLRPLAARCLAAMGVWMVLALVPLLRTSNSVTFGYVVAVATVLLAAWLLVRQRTLVVVLIALTMVALQVNTVLTRGKRTIDNGDRRVPAAATFLIEHRPDLLRAEKTAFLPRDEASNVGQYARGQHRRIIMPVAFPVERTLHSVGSKEDVLRAFVDAYEQRGEIRADWLVLTSELVREQGPAAHFYRRLRDDPRIRWIAVFRDGLGREMWVGEVQPGGAGGPGAPAYDVDQLARIYETKYDRISFLKHNVRYVMHD